METIFHLTTFLYWIENYTFEFVTLVLLIGVSEVVGQVYKAGESETWWNFMGICCLIWPFVIDYYPPTALVILISYLCLLGFRVKRIEREKKLKKEIEETIKKSIYSKGDLNEHDGPSSTD